jgi:hypothetical protein
MPYDRTYTPTYTYSMLYPRRILQVILYRRHKLQVVLHCNVITSCCTHYNDTLHFNVSPDAGDGIAWPCGLVCLFGGEMVLGIVVDCTVLTWCCM